MQDSKESKNIDSNKNIKDSKEILESSLHNADISHSPNVENIESSNKDSKKDFNKSLNYNDVKDSNNSKQNIESSLQDSKNSKNIDSKQNQYYNFLVAINKQTQGFDALLGFIITRLYDKNIKTKDIWLAIWKAKESCPSLGLQLILYLQKQDFDSIGAVGISSSGLKFYKALRYNLGYMKHFYIKNNKINNFKIATFIESKTNQDSKTKDSIKAKILTKQEIIESNLDYKYYPTKTITYFINRYINHKFYKYEAYGIYINNKLKTIFIFREVQALDSKCLRITDMLGEFPKCDISESLQELLEQRNAEYIDLLCHVPNQSEIIESGFRLKQKGEIIPNYFEPFVKDNVDISFAYKSKNKNYTFFKGDSDQDRPNFIESNHKGATC
ncbi:hypothetical protein DCO58_07605 [Helicobacter saguini]|uniref:Uncharacterized protein n=1 Tax=Helicobacter saguini TaxID=1548018 RepID=A0A347W4L4_9HELI|nr:hypothetical protein [Helicobacter saguini]MWV61802.1 hypothetical protein [Helicobacter saguini]MWV67523.1 hypothetical protein [Helicobacter saguini]MWV69874.1 hypothetical protein [Helicobacter saguini]TLD93260.1 hypothetical protein LS64_009105 [Helicobacter saguini]